LRSVLNILLNFQAESVHSFFSEPKVLVESSLETQSSNPEPLYYFSAHFLTESTGICSKRTFSILKMEVNCKITCTLSSDINHVLPLRTSSWLSGFVHFRPWRDKSH